MDRRVKGKIDRLPESVKAAVDRLLIEGETYENIQTFLEKKGFSVGLSSVGRYAVRQRKIRETAVQARFLVEEIQAAGLDLDRAMETIAGQRLLELVTNLDAEESDELAGALPALLRIRSQALRQKELEIKAAELAGRTAAEAGPAPKITRKIETPADAVAALFEAIELKMNKMLSSPAELSHAAAKDVRACLFLADELKARYAGQAAEKGLSDDKAEEIRAKVLGVKG